MNYLTTLMAVMSIFSSSVMAFSVCTAYPAGNWKLDSESALRFENTWLQMLEAKNVAAIDCMLAPEFADTSRKGALRPKTQVLQELPLQKEQDKYRQTLTELEADLFGDSAVIHGVNLISDREGHEVLRIRFTDVLHYSQGRWLAIAAQETDQQQH